MVCFIKISWGVLLLKCLLWPVMGLAQEFMGLKHARHLLQMWVDPAYGQAPASIIIDVLTKGVSLSGVTAVITGSTTKDYTAMGKGKKPVGRDNTSLLQKCCHAHQVQPDILSPKDGKNLFGGHAWAIMRGCRLIMSHAALKSEMQGRLSLEYQCCLETRDFSVLDGGVRVDDVYGDKSFYTYSMIIPSPFAKGQALFLCPLWKRLRDYIV